LRFILLLWRKAECPQIVTHSKETSVNYLIILAENNYSFEVPLKCLSQRGRGLEVYMSSTRTFARKALSFYVRRSDDCKAVLAKQSHAIRQKLASSSSKMCSITSTITTASAPLFCSSNGDLTRSWYKKVVFDKLASRSLQASNVRSSMSIQTSDWAALDKKVAPNPSPQPISTTTSAA